MIGASCTAKQKHLNFGAVFLKEQMLWSHMALLSAFKTRTTQSITVDVRIC